MTRIWSRTVRAWLVPAAAAVLGATLAPTAGAADAVRADHAVSTSMARPDTAGTIRTAAALYGWGKPLSGSDEFSYTGAPDPRKWQTIDGCGPGSGGVGQRCASHATVGGGFLRESGSSSGDTGWVGSRTALKGGRWEARVRLGVDGSSGHPYHPVLLTWPLSDRWPESGEYDFLEVDMGDKAASAFIHYPNSNNQVQRAFTSRPINLTQWHTYGFQWDAKAGTLTGYLDGAPWFYLRDAKAMAPEPMQGTIQLDNYYGSGLRAAHMDVDFYRIYAAP